VSATPGVVGQSVEPFNFGLTARKAFWAGAYTVLGVFSAEQMGITEFVRQSLPVQYQALAPLVGGVVAAIFKAVGNLFSTRAMR
jgi:hypothetical protein